MDAAPQAMAIPTAESAGHEPRALAEAVLELFSTNERFRRTTSIESSIRPRPAMMVRQVILMFSLPVQSSMSFVGRGLVVQQIYDPPTLSAVIRRMRVGLTGTTVAWGWPANSSPDFWGILTSRIATSPRRMGKILPASFAEAGGTVYAFDVAGNCVRWKLNSRAGNTPRIPAIVS
jgi:hypothetical protein